jgi:hypothetical protein
MAFYNDVTFLSMVSLIVIVGLGFVILWFISKLLYSLFCFDIIKVYNDTTNDNNIIDSIIQVNNPFQESTVISIQRHSIEDTNDDIPVAELV